MSTPSPGYGQQPQQHSPQQPQQPQQHGTPPPAGYGAPAAHGGGSPVPPGYGAPVPGPSQQGPQATIDLTVQGSVMMRSFVPPTIWVNGHVLTPKYGQRDVPVPAGPVRVDVECQWMRKYGQASLSFTAQPGQTVPVFYAAPAHQFTTGAIGHTKQKHKGMGFVWGILGVALALIVFAVVLPFALG
ncbi:hypothetical protein [Litorihabitans aurantiacus]|uniref:Uncharacterized protein n=1 Tax=Litorihabitans aurantiacus TaxID=1930061 RepID=A0AA37URG8_9MICO|nr:hypothetical protein [Litorihabitans aurantiacus]GMA30275.1 hypothetical protein GCM10025875_02670 [Litorihabitans aurantiacus]